MPYLAHASCVDYIIHFINIYFAGIAFICDVDVVKLSHICSEEGLSLISSSQFYNISQGSGLDQLNEVNSKALFIMSATFLLDDFIFLVKKDEGTEYSFKQMTCQSDGNSVWKRHM